MEEEEEEEEKEEKEEEEEEEEWRKKIYPRCWLGLRSEMAGGRVWIQVQ